MSDLSTPSKRIAIILPDLRGGGAERVNINLANELVLRGFSVDMILMQRSGELLPLLEPDVRIIGLRAARVRGALFPLVRYLKREKPSALLACMWPITVMAVFARVLVRLFYQCPTRVIVAEHTSWSSAELTQKAVMRWFVARSMQFFFKQADAVVAVSAGAAKDLCRMAHLKADAVTTIYNPIVDITKNAPTGVPSSPARWSEGSHRRVIAVGTLKSIKDYPTLLRAFAELRLRKDVRLLILGEGSERLRLEELARSLGVSDFVDLPGFVQDTAPYLAHADLLVLSSICEGLPTVVVEALAQGIPVVSTDCPSGPREILKDGEFGRLVPVGNIDAMAYQMGLALSTECDSAKLKARARDFSIDKATDAYLRVLLGSHASEKRSEHRQQIA